MQRLQVLIFFLLLVNLSTDDKPSEENANNATASTKTGEGATSTVEKLL